METLKNCKLQTAAYKTVPPVIHSSTHKQKNTSNNKPPPPPHTHTHTFSIPIISPLGYIYSTYVIPSIYDASLVEPLTKLCKLIYKQQFNVCAEP